MSERKRAFLIVSASIVGLYLLFSGMWSPMRWDRYISVRQEVVPIEFYAQVVDEKGQPLEGVQMNLAISTVNWAFLLGDDNVRTDKLIQSTTDANGRFEVKDERGSAIIIEDLQKPGYEYRPKINEGGFYYAGAVDPRLGPYRPNPAKPEVFTLHSTRK